MRFSSNIPIKFSTIIFILFMIVDCGVPRKTTKSEISEEYIWPPPPDPPRIQYVKTIHSEMDVGRQRTLAQKIFEAIFGRPMLRALKKPLAVHADRFGRVMVVDTGWHKVLIFNFKDKILQFLGTKGRGRLLNPLGVTTDSSGTIYVSDEGGKRIMIYDSEGNFLSAFGGKDVFTRPSGIVVNLNLDRIYVVDTWQHQVKVLDRNNGNLLFTIGKQGESPEKPIHGALDHTGNRSDADGEFRFPTRIAIGADGKIYVVDTLNFRVQIFTADGEFVKSFGKVGNLPGNFYRPKGIGIDNEGHIYVSDASYNNIQIFDEDGRLLLNFGSFGAGKADIRLPAGLHVNGENKIYVVDQFNNRIQVYQYLGS